MKITGFAVALALFWLSHGALAQTGRAEALNDAALSAFNAGDTGQAILLTQEALSDGSDSAEPVAHLIALNNLFHLLNLAEEDPNMLMQTASRALSFADETDQRDTTGGFTAQKNRATALFALGRQQQAVLAVTEMLQQARATPMHGAASIEATDAYFRFGAYRRMVAVIVEMGEVTGGYQANTTIDVLYARQEQLELEGDIEAVSALIDGRIALVALIAPDLLEEFSHTALWQKFYMNYKAQNLGAAADALEVWVNTGTASPDELDFLRVEAEGNLILAQHISYSGQGRLQLDQTQYLVALSRLAYADTDARLGYALRERAAAETDLGQYEQANATLQEAVAVLLSSDGGQAEVYLVLEDLAANAWQRDQLEVAAGLYAQADAMYRAGLAQGAQADTSFDLMILAHNRAKLAVDRGEAAAAADYLAQANAHYAQAAAEQELLPNQTREQAGLLETQALLAYLRGEEDAARDAALRAADVARSLYTPGHPGQALALANAADLLFVLGDPDQAEALLHEADQIASAALPADTPLVVEINSKLVLAALQQGDIDTALQRLRLVTRARQSPLYRAGLAGAVHDFELMAWALLSRPAPSGAEIDEALAAIQWTQISQSADALAMMGARMAAANPAHAALLKHRQDLILEATRNRSALLAAYAAHRPDEQVSQDLNQRQAELAAALTQAEDEIAAAGLELSGLGRVQPLGLAEIQQLLAPGDVLVTFVLPGLRAEMVPGLDGSANLVVAISQTEVSFAPIAEPSRAALNRKISAFRCEMAISDPGCGTGAAALLRGAMLDDVPQDGPVFDWQLAHGLYQDLFGGVASAVSAADHVIIVPPSDLLRLPFQALITAPQPDFSLQTADWMIRQQAISVLPSIPSFALLRRDTPPARQPPRLLGIGDPLIGTGPAVDCDNLTLAALRSNDSAETNLFSGGYAQGVALADPVRLANMARLADAACELRAISASFGPQNSTLLMQNAATETEIKALSQSGALAGYDVLVFSTHGLVADETSAVSPGLVMTPPARATLLDDGLLTASEVAALSLNARLVVLSACSTAAGENAAEEGLSGLARGFFQAGAKALMVTHWSVYSEAAVEVTTGLFAAQAAAPELSLPAALRRSTLAILDDPMADALRLHPAYWAPFAIIGP
ncbi:MAG: CHAT domain-containing protein [Rhodobacteraceae bacterium]|nr:CHAT domain-containing protein [Paracoccaceae bacterium]